MQLRKFRADLHVHTVLSPCAEIEMIPPLIVSEAISRGIQLIAITDHNKSENISAVQRAAAGKDLIVLPGIEIQSKEEVHILCLFDTLDQINHFQEIVDKNLPDLPNKPEYFGHQLIVDETGDFIKFEEQLLITSTKLSINDVWEIVDKLDGLAIPAHINRKANGLLEILGFVPPDIPFQGLEISRHITPAQAIEKFPHLKKYTLIQSGDVHRCTEFLGSTYFNISEPTIKEIRLALSGKNGRSITIHNS
jgi:PHP family Zn ribbon phosphoesterase